MSRITVLVLLALGLGGLQAAGATAADSAAGKALFEQSCQGCHTIGGGDLTGPDLAGLADRREADWVRRFIVAPDEVLASDDPIAQELLAKYGAPMPNLGITDAQADDLLVYLGFAAAQPQPQPEPEPEPQPEPAPTPSGDATRGEDLFTGAGGFENGGPSCLSCHAVAGVGALGGGQLGPDLTDSFAKYGGATGLNAVLENVAFPTMIPIFSRKPLTASERTDLVAFLEQAPDQERSSNAVLGLLGLSLAVVALLAGAALLIWRRRLGGVRKPLVNPSRGK